VIGVAAAGVMALGAQTATSSTVGPVDSTPPDLQLSGPKKQHPTIRPGQGCGPRSLKTTCSLRVKASCGDEACTARVAKGKLTKVNRDLRQLKFGPRGIDVAPHETRKLRLYMTEKMRKKALQAVHSGKNVQAKVTVRATDAAGNVATAKRTITLK
jgi:hypothetical protein